MSEIKIPICEFGKKLDLKDIIEKVEYVKGDKNDIGDDPEDYVRIVIRDGS
jgi:topoisomerase IA-like protein